MIKRIVKLTFHPDNIEAFKQIFQESKDSIRAFDGCHHVELLQSRKPANVFFTFSIWDSEAALNQYRYSELFQSIWAKTKLLFSDRPKAWSVDYIDEGKTNI